MTWDPLLLDEEVPSASWVPFRVRVRSSGATLVVVVEGQVDAWTGGALLRHLADAWTSGHREVVLDLSRASCPDRTSGAALTRCGAFVAERGAQLRIVQPDVAA